MLLAYFVGCFVVIMVGLVLPFCAWMVWFEGKTYNLDEIGNIAMGVAIISWVLAFWNWLRDSSEEDN